MSKEQTDRGFVLVTGTSTGIGAATALHLAENGFHVFAGVRREVDGEALQGQTLKTLTPLIIDVTDEATISAAAAAGLPMRATSTRRPAEVDESLRTYIM